MQDRAFTKKKKKKNFNTIEICLEKATDLADFFFPLKLLFRTIQNITKNTRFWLRLLLSEKKRKKKILKKLNVEYSIRTSGIRFSSFLALIRCHGYYEKSKIHGEMCFIPKNAFFSLTWNLPFSLRFDSAVVSHSLAWYEPSIWACIFYPWF